jgi:hypothetical protein
MGLLAASITWVFHDWSKPLIVGVMGGLGAVSLLVLIVEGELSGRRWPLAEFPPPPAPASGGDGDRREAIRRYPPQDNQEI